MSEPTTRTPPAAPRLSFRWRRSADPQTDYELTVMEHLATKVRATVYDVRETTPPKSAGRTFLFAKAQDDDGPRPDEVYETFVGGGLAVCSCPGHACRKGGYECRHIQAVRALVDDRQDPAEVPAGDHMTPEEHDRWFAALSERVRVAREALPEIFRDVPPSPLGCPF